MLGLLVRGQSTRTIASFALKTCLSRNSISFLQSKRFFNSSSERLFKSKTWATKITNQSIDNGKRSFATEEAAYSVDELENRENNANLLRLITAYRRYGHILADLDPLKLEKKTVPPELELSRYGLDKISPEKEFPLPGLISIPGRTHASLREILEHLNSVYCGKVGGEFLYIQQVIPRRWFSDQMENLQAQELSNEEKLRVLQLMIEAETFDHFMQKKFPFVKRYALEGNEAMVPCIDAIFSRASELGVTDVVVAMPHRGRLNLLCGLLKFPARDFFWKVKGNSELPDDIQGIGDVISHIGTSIDLEYGGKKLHVSLIQNPSHLEAIDPVALGKVRAKQALLSDDKREKVMCLMLHGDAAFYGQGTVAETLGLSKLKEFTTGGTIHLIVNNQVGFTTTATHGRSSRYSADVGKMVDCPAIHVNSDSPEDVVKAAKLATDYRQLFKEDIMLDLIGYRRHGHNELDEPSFTQPIMYKAIRAHPSVIKLYSSKLEDEGIVTSSDIQSLQAQNDQKWDEELKKVAKPTTTTQHLQGNWKGFIQTRDATVQVDTGVDSNVLKQIGEWTTKTPEDFNIHSRLKKMFAKARSDSIQQDKLDWATAEAMSFGSLLQEGYSIRLCGQDSGRGTFSHRHAELVDQETERKYVPLANLPSQPGKTQGKFQVVNSPLSELAVMGFEYGYSIEDPKSLVLWEAQFGDFSNGAQAIIDLFITCGEAKWLKQSGLVLLLPHGYDGAGPEHSSGRIERFLQLLDEDGNLTTPANYFHSLRRQQLRNFRKPVVMMTPKTLLRMEKAVSSLKDMAPGTHFLPVIGDNEVSPNGVTRVFICSGKVYYSLVEERKKRGYEKDTAIIRIEELSPFPVEQITAEVSKYKNAKVYWVQDESQNAGSWWYVQPRLVSLFGKVEYIGRPPCAASAVGIYTIHNKEYENLIEKAFPKK